MDKLKYCVLGALIAIGFMIAKDYATRAYADPNINSVEGITEDVRMIDGPNGSSAYMYTIMNERDERYVITISNTGNVTLNRVR